VDAESVDGQRILELHDPIGRRAVQIPAGSPAYHAQRRDLGDDRRCGAARYRIGISANIINLTNHANFVGYTGTMTSPVLLPAQNVQNMRTCGISLGCEISHSNYDPGASPAKTTTSQESPSTNTPRRAFGK
jgi:hypothetical protein